MILESNAEVIFVFYITYDFILYIVV